MNSTKQRWSARIVQLSLAVLCGGAVFVSFLRGKTGMAPQSIRRHQQPEEHARLLVEGVKDYALFMLDPSGMIVSWNCGAEAIKGYRAQEIIGRRYSVLFTEDDRKRRKPESILNRAAQEGRVTEEGWRVRKDGTRFMADVVVTALRNEQGALSGFAKVTRDVTERKHAQEALRQSEERFRGIYEHAPIGIAIMDLDGRFQQCNPSFGILVGAGEGTLREHNLVHVLHPEDRTMIMSEVRRLVTGHISCFDKECRYLDNEGKTVWVHQVVSLLYDAQAAPAHLMALVSNVSERHRMEEALHRSEGRLRAVMAAAEIGSWEWDLLTNEGSVDERCQWLLGLPQSGAVAYDEIQLAVHPDDRHRVKQALLAVRTQGVDHYEAEYRVCLPQSERWILARGRALRNDEGTAVRMVGIVLDTTHPSETSRRRLAPPDHGTRGACAGTNA